MTISCDGETINKSHFLQETQFQQKLLRHWIFFLSTVGPSTAKHGSAKNGRTQAFISKHFNAFFGDALVIGGK